MKSTALSEYDLILIYKNSLVHVRTYSHTYIYIYVHILIHNALGWTIATEYVNIIECVHIYIYDICVIYIIYACAFTPLVRAYPKWLIDTKLMAKQHYWKVTCRPPLGAVSWCLSDGFKKKDWNKNNLYYNMTHKKCQTYMKVAKTYRMLFAYSQVFMMLLPPSWIHLLQGYGHGPLFWKRLSQWHGGSKPRTCFMWETHGILWDPLISDIPKPESCQTRFFPWFSHGFSSSNQVFPMIFLWIFQFKPAKPHWITSLGKLSAPEAVVSGVTEENGEDPKVSSMVPRWDERRCVIGLSQHGVPSSILEQISPYILMDNLWRLLHIFIDRYGS